MNHHSIVYQGISKTGRDITICYPQMSDAQILCDYINALSKERIFLRLQGEHVPLEAEKKWLKSFLEKIDQHKAIMLTVWSKDSLVGTASIIMEEAIHTHVGVLGITLAKDARAEGIGTILLDSIITVAKKELPQMELIRMTLYAQNKIALHMYEKYGFVTYGVLPKGIKRGNDYDDHVYMYKRMK